MQTELENVPYTLLDTSHIIALTTGIMYMIKLDVDQIDILIFQVSFIWHLFSKLNYVLKNYEINFITLLD